MASFNPYAPLAGAHGPSAAPHAAFGHARLEGDVLVVRRDAALPDVCFKCGSHDGIVRRNAKFQWTPMWARLMVVLCTLGGAIAMLVTTKRATLAVPLCGGCNQRWSQATTALIAGVVALVLGILSFNFVDEVAVGGVVFFVALAGFIGLAVGFVRPRTLQVHKIDEQEIHFKGFDHGAAREAAGGVR